MNRYKTFKTYKNSHRKVTVSTGLTEAEAQAEVQKDIDINPDCLVYMLCYTKQ